MQKTVCQYLLPVLRNPWQNFYQLKKKPTSGNLLKIFISPDKGDMKILSPGIQPSYELFCTIEQL